MDYIKRIKKIKTEQKITNDELAERTGIAGGTLAKILAGISESPKLSNFVAICEALNCSLDYIMYGIEENSNNYTLSDDEIEMIERFRALDDRGRDTVLSVLEKQEGFSRGEQPAAPKRARILSPEPLRARLAAAYEQSDNGFGKRTLPLYDLPVSAGVGVMLDSDTADEITVSDNTRTR
ncbi:MAG: helix-turn-helix transcriptional regulator [Clostridia bacterium]|nr:helix-turn-helix transcriptional regulator [Clostridia bacterium]